MLNRSTGTIADYGLSTGRAETVFGSCNEVGSGYRRAYVTRLEDCGQDCPAPTVAESYAEYEVPLDCLPLVLIANDG